MKNRLMFYWAPLIILIIAIFVMSVIPNHYLLLEEPSLLSKIFNQYTQHLFAFFVLFVLCYRLFRIEFMKLSLFRMMLYSFLFTITISFSKEYLQLFIPSRTFNPVDILVDGVGALLGLLGMRIKMIQHFSDV